MEELRNEFFDKWLRTKQTEDQWKWFADKMSSNKAFKAGQDYVLDSIFNSLDNAKRKSERI